MGEEGNLNFGQQKITRKENMSAAEINFEMNEKGYLKMNTQLDQIRYEFTNQDTIALRKSGAYFKAMGNSAVMMKMLGGKTKIRSHLDATVKQEVFEMSIHAGRIEETKKFLMPLAAEVLRDDGTFFVVRLKKPAGSKQIRKAKRTLGLKAEVAEDILTQRRKETPMSREVRYIFGEAGLLVRTMKGTDGLVLGRMILERVLQLETFVRELMISEKYERVDGILIDCSVDQLQGLLVMVPNFELEAERLARMGRSLLRIKIMVEELEGKLKKDEALKKKANLGGGGGGINV